MKMRRRLYIMACCDYYCNYPRLGDARPGAESHGFSNAGSWR